MSRKAWVAALLGATLALAALGTYQKHGKTVLAFNGTPSVPVGFYLARRNPRALEPGDLTCVRNEALPDWARARQYLPDGMSLCKRVAATTGGTVLREGSRLRVCTAGGECLESALRGADSHGRELRAAFPEGRSGIPAGQVYLYSEHPKGLDSRYLGLMPLSDTFLRLTPLLVSGPEH
ncbi:MAG: hypothetical protein QG637_856 [Chloroflexota bacterium]|nr:hypothetical protein [Chloroflexota bacterium]